MSHLVELSEKGKKFGIILPVFSEIQLGVQYGHGTVESARGSGILFRAAALHG